MLETIRYHLDESAPGAVAAGLRRMGIDVTLPQEAGLLGTSDEEQLAFALGENRVVFTQDDDFLVLHASGAAHAGIVYCHQENCSIGDILRALKFIWASYEPEEMTGQVHFVSRS